MSPFVVAGVAVLALLSPSGAVGQPANLAMHDAPQDLAPITFQDEAGQTLSLDQWRGKYVLLNIWATWCVPCRREMPTLDNLQAALGNEHFEVLALSIDRAGAGAVRRSYDEIGISKLRLVGDEGGGAAVELRVIGLPTTILIDPEGREIGRLIGPAEWDTRETLEFILNIISPWKERR